MRKRMLALFVTLHDDSETASFFAERENVDGLWEWLSDGESLSSRELSEAVDGFKGLLELMTADWSKSSSRTS